MSRLPRLQMPSLLRHVMSRGNGKMPIFLDDTDYRWFVYLLGNTLEPLSVRCWSYCLMPNHYHLCIQPQLPNLSEVARLLNSGYAQWWNRRHERVGHVFQGRFKDQVVDHESYAVVLARYIVMNPVRAGLVTSPDEWPWSSFRATAGLTESPSFLDTGATLSLFGEAPTNTLQSQFVRAMVTPGTDPVLLDRIRSSERVIGSSAFKKQIDADQESSLGSTGLAPAGVVATARPHTHGLTLA